MQNNCYTDCIYVFFYFFPSRQVPPSAVTYIKRMRLPLLAATIGMVFILLLDLFIIDTRPVTREDRAAIQAQEAEEDKIDRKDLLFSQAAWDSVQDTDDWDAVSFVCYVLFYNKLLAKNAIYC